MGNYKYRLGILKYLCISSNNIGTSYNQLINRFIEIYGDIDYNYDLIDKEEQSKIIEKYIKKHKINKDKDKVKIEQIINMKSQVFQAINYYYNHNKKKNFEEVLLNLKINDKNYIYNLNVNYKRKNINYNSNIYIIMTDVMESNIKANNNIQYFMDVTYYSTPSSKNKFKLFVLLAFNKDKYKTILCNLSLIEKENTEIFITILEHLKYKYNLIPKKISIDFSKAEYKAIKAVFPNIIIIPCFFHFINNIIKRIPQIRSKNKRVKKLAYDLLANRILLCFINRNNIKTFFNKIKNKFSNDFPNFFNKFEKIYLNTKPYNVLYWNL